MNTLYPMAQGYNFQVQVATGELNSAWLFNSANAGLTKEKSN
jgi:hypothetical protein